MADERDGKVRLHLPQGFHYRSFHDTESPVALDDGTRATRGGTTGWAPSAAAGRTSVLVRNHEINNPQPAFGPAGRTTPWPVAAPRPCG